ncbi:TPA: 2-C-methyl-D-erythritol 4-phosphate cytidylyltransferase [bacterium]|nr:2-C-methyl-D-erythritol 4-phosphate cytidylyltransferase [bacterium]
MKTEVILVAGGASQRMGDDKLYLLLDGYPLISYTIRAILKFVGLPILVVSRERFEWWKENRFGISKLVCGGEKRQDSVYEGLKMLDVDTENVLVHDGARPFVSKSLLERVISELNRNDAVVPGIPSSLTVKSVKGGIVEKTLPREDIWFIQTPQGFKKDVFISAYKKAYEDGFYGTDCASLVERTGCKIKVIPGDEKNIKITTKFDFEIAKMIVQKKLREDV